MSVEDKKKNWLIFCEFFFDGEAPYSFTACLFRRLSGFDRSIPVGLFQPYVSILIV